MVVSDDEKAPRGLATTDPDSRCRHLFELVVRLESTVIRLRLAR